MSAGTPPTVWPSDPGHRDAIETILEMAAAEDRWGEPSRAIDLLESVERLVGALPQPYERIRRRCRDAAQRR